jgi:hypothetical protein
MQDIIVYVLCLIVGALIGFGIKCLFNSKDEIEEINRMEERLKKYEQEGLKKKKPKSKYKFPEDIIEDGNEFY